MAYGKGSNNSGVVGGLKVHVQGKRIKRNMAKAAGRQSKYGKRRGKK